MSEILSLLQVAIGPVIIISGVGLLILSMTNRFARVVDRIRILIPELHNEDKNKIKYTSAQLRFLWKRANLLRMTILLANFTALCAALLIVIIFISQIFTFNLSLIIEGIFIVGMISLIWSLLLFVIELNQALNAVKLELQSNDVFMT